MRYSAASPTEAASLFSISEVKGLSFSRLALQVSVCSLLCVVEVSLLSFTFPQWSTSMFLHRRRL